MRSSLAQRIISWALILLLLASCGLPETTPNSLTPSPGPESTPSLPAPVLPTPQGSPSIPPGNAELSQIEIATLNSLRKIGDYPLYVMDYFGAYHTTGAFSGVTGREGMTESAGAPSPWACSLFAAFGSADSFLLGRNFDWEFSPALLLFTDPPDGYASVSMVDIAYLGLPTAALNALTELPLKDRKGLMDAPYKPFDGMNERGLAIGMAAVPDGLVPLDPNKETIDSLRVIREVLDHAQNVDQAVEILQAYNIDFSGGPPIHYLLADATGRSILLEHYQGEIVLIPNQNSWQAASNFLRASVGASPEGQCWRYDAIEHQLERTGGRMTSSDAMDLLQTVSQNNTQWSIVYGISSGEINVVMGQEFKAIHTLYLSPLPSD